MPVITRFRAGIVTSWRDPMRRSSYALILGTVITSGLGMGFWVVAGRVLSTEVVGTGAALLSAMSFLATVSTLGLRNSMVRFLASAGASTRALIRLSGMSSTELR